MAPHTPAWDDLRACQPAGRPTPASSWLCVSLTLGNWDSRTSSAAGSVRLNVAALPLTGNDGGQGSARGRPATAVPAHADDSQRQVGVRVLLVRCREEGALGRGRAATLLRYLEPPLHRLGAF